MLIIVKPSGVNTCSSSLTVPATSLSSMAARVNMPRTLKMGNRKKAPVVHTKRTNAGKAFVKQQKELGWTDSEIDEMFVECNANKTRQTQTRQR